MKFRKYGWNSCCWVVGFFLGGGLSGSGDIIQTNIPWGFEPSLWPWPSGQQSKIVTQHSWWRVHHYTTFVCERFTNSGDAEEKQNSFFLGPHCDLDLEDRNPTFSGSPAYQDWLHTFQWFGRHRTDKGVTDGHTDNLIPIYPKRIIKSI